MSDSKFRIHLVLVLNLVYFLLTPLYLHAETTKKDLREETERLAEFVEEAAQTVEEKSIEPEIKGDDGDVQGRMHETCISMGGGEGGGEGGYDPCGGGSSGGGFNPGTNEYLNTPSIINSAKAGVSESTGSAQFSLPLQALPGLRGIQPSLSLSYARGANGWLGRSFALQGLGAIMRYGETLKSVPTFNDTVDNFRIESPVANGELVPSLIAPGAFDTRVASHVKIERVGTYEWTLLTKANYLYRFGSDTDLNSVIRNGSNIAGWLLTSIEDPLGNVVSISYNGNNSPNQITYANRSIQFNYTTRSDNYPTSNYGFPYGYPSVIETIEFFVNGNKTHQYFLTYEERTASKSYLQSVSFSGTDPAQSVSWTFDYSDGGDGEVFLTTGEHDFEDTIPVTFSRGITGGSPPVQPANWVMSDINYDGWKDIVMISDDTAYPEGVYYHLRIPGSSIQFEPEVEVIKPNSVSEYRRVFRRSGRESYPYATNSWTHLWYNDFTGDLKPDLLQYSMLDDMGDQDALYQGFYRGVGAANGVFDLTDYYGEHFADLFANSPFVGPLLRVDKINVNDPDPIHNVPGLNVPFSIDRGVRAADVNGDGLTDLVMAFLDKDEDIYGEFTIPHPRKAVLINNGVAPGENSPTFSLSSGFAIPTVFTEYMQETIWHGYVCPPYCPPPYEDVIKKWTEPKKVIIVELNGDGLPDLLKLPEEEGDPHRVWINQGKSGWSTTSSTWEDSIPDAVRSFAAVQFIDVNSDGFSDLIYGNEIFMNTGNGFEAEASQTIPHNLWSGSYKGIQFEDINRNGLVDFVTAPYSATDKIYLNQRALPDLLLEVTLPTGATQRFDYQSIANYETSGASFNPELPLTMPVVRTVTSTDLLGVNRATSYAYRGGKWDSERREFAGFEHVDTIRPDGAHTEKWYHQELELRGRVKSSILSAVGAESTDPLTPLSGQSLYDLNALTRASTTFIVSSSEPYRINVAQQVNEENQNAGAGQASSFVPALSELQVFDDWGDLTEQARYLGQPFVNQISYIRTSYARDAAQFISLSCKDEHADIDASNYFKEVRRYYDSQPLCTVSSSGFEGLITREETSSLNDGKTYASDFIYDSSGLLTSVSENGGSATVISYNAAGTFTESITRAQGSGYEEVTSFVADSIERVDNETDPNGIVTQYGYDSFSRQTSLTKGSTVTNTLYDLAGLSKMTSRLVDGAQYISKLEFFDGFGRSLGETSFNYSMTQPISVARQYDGLGRLTRETFPYAGSAWTPSMPAKVSAYDERGRVTSELNELSGQLSSSEFGFQSMEYTDPDGQIKSFTYDGLGRVTSRTEYECVGEPTDCPALTVLYRYDDNHGLEEAEDPDGNITTITYTDFGEKKSISRPDIAGPITYDYDASGNLNLILLPSGRWTFYQYDDLKRQVYVLQSDGRSATLTHGNATDGRGPSIGYLTNELHSLPGGITVTRDFWYENNEEGRISQSVENIDGASVSFNHTYFDGGIPETYSIAGPTSAETLTYSLDDRGRLESISSDQNGGTTLVDAVVYDTIGRITDYDIQGSGYSVELDFGSGSWLNQQRLVDNSSGAIVSDRILTYDNRGNILTVDDTYTSTSFAYEYDGLNRLISAELEVDGNPETLDYDYEHTLRLKSVTSSLTGQTAYEYGEAFDPGDPGSFIGGPFAVISDGTHSLSYDSDGAVQSYGNYDFSYNSELQVTSVAYNSSQIETNLYDALGRKVSHEKAGTITKHFSDGVSYDGSEQLNQYRLGSFTIGEHSSVNGTRLFIQDQNMTPFLTLEQGGTLPRTVHYPYGARFLEESNQTDLKYMCKEADVLETAEELEVYHLEGRTYIPALRHFIQPDPVLHNPDKLFSSVHYQNLYGYSFDNPISFSDPDGRDPLGAIIGGVLSGGAAALGTLQTGGLDALLSTEGVLTVLGATAVGAVGGAIGNPIEVVHAAAEGYAAGLRIGNDPSALGTNLQNNMVHLVGIATFGAGNKILQAQRWGAGKYAIDKGKTAWVARGALKEGLKGKDNLFQMLIDYEESVNGKPKYKGFNYPGHLDGDLPWWLQELIDPGRGLACVSSGGEGSGLSVSTTCYF